MRSGLAPALCLVLPGVLFLSPAATEQAPDLPPLPRLQGICRSDDGPAPGWMLFVSPDVGMKVRHPPGWAARPTAGDQIEFVTGGQIVLHLMRLDVSPLTPLEWLRERVRAQIPGCRVVAIGVFFGHQCFDQATNVWTTHLILTRHVVGVQAPSLLPREVYCGILVGMEPD